MCWAVAHAYAVFTHDLDFGTMLAPSGDNGPSVMQVRCLNVLPDVIGHLVLFVLKTDAAEIEQGALVVADERRERVKIPALTPLPPAAPSSRCAGCRHRRARTPAAAAGAAGRPAPGRLPAPDR